MDAKQKSRPSWDDYFMAIARIVATRSTCDRLMAGAVLVKNKRIISTGYNGSPPGMPHCDDVGHLMEEGHCVRTVHDAHNAILQAATIPGASTEGSTLYAIYTPCIHCAKYIVAAGIKRVVFARVYRHPQASDYLKSAGIEVQVYQPNEEWNRYLVDLFATPLADHEAKEGHVKFTEKHQRD